MDKFLFINPLLNNDNLCQNTELTKVLKNKNKNKDKFEEWIINYDEINKFCKDKEYNPLKFIYFNKNKIHKILYDKDETIYLDSNESEKNLSYYFYLSLLIKDNPNIINYSYSFQFIKEINDNIQNNNNRYKKFIISKIILELIENYKNVDGCSEYQNNKIEKIESENNKIIKDNINNFNKEFNLEWKEEQIKSKKIDEIYLKIIKSLIEKNKFDKYEYIYNIIKELDLELIDITKTIFDGIHDIIKRKENQYLISNNEDLFNNKKINFYYILLKYILKNSIFIYQINFLMKTRKYIIKLIKSNKSYINEILFSKDIYENIKERLKYIIEKITDSDYYKKLINKEKRDYKDEISEKMTINNDNNYSIHSMTTNGNSSNLNLPIIKKANIFNDLNYTNKNGEISENQTEINKSVIKTTKQNTIQNQIKTTNQNTTQNQNKVTKQNINHNESLSDLINNKSSYKKTFSSSSPSSCVKEKEEKEENFKILKLFKTIKMCQNKNDRYTLDFITEINDYFICGGAYQYLFIFNSKYEKIRQQYIGKDWVYNVLFYSESNNINKESTIFVGCSKNSLFSYSINNNSDKYITSKSEKNNNNYLLQIKKNEFLCCQENQLSKWSDIAKQLLRSIHSVFDEFNKILTKSAIKINNTIIFKSNKVVSNGQDKLIFLDFNSKRIFATNINKKYYSCIYSPNGLFLLPKDEKMPKIGVLLCACKKYLKYQKNGILLLSFENDENIENDNNRIYYYFYCTKDFEVYCFSPLAIIDTKEVFISINIKKFYTYFLVGGFDVKKRKGLIKLYKVIYSEKYDEIKIEYIQDIILFDSKQKKVIRIKEPISYIAQSSKEGQLLVTSWDGNIYLFECPNISYYLKYNKLKIK